MHIISELIFNLNEDNFGNLANEDMKKHKNWWNFNYSLILYIVEKKIELYNWSKQITKINKSKVHCKYKKWLEKLKLDLSSLHCKNEPGDI